MPTYDYVCRACGHEFELFQMMSDAVKRTCPKCKKAKLERLIGTGAGVIFKGSGFYETDYRSEGYKKAAEAEAKAASPTSKKSDFKTETKSDASKTDDKKAAMPEKAKADSTVTTEGRGTRTPSATGKAPAKVGKGRATPSTIAPRSSRAPRRPRRA